MAEEVDPRVTVYVRHKLIGDNRNSTELGARWNISAPTVTNIRKGKQGVGGGVMARIADADFGGSIDDLRRAAADFAKQNPQLFDDVTPVLEQAVGMLTIEAPENAGRIVAAFGRLKKSAIQGPLILGDAVIRLREAASAEPGPAIAKRDRAWLELALPLAGVSPDAANDVAWTMHLQQGVQEPADLFAEAVRVARLNEAERAGNLPPAAPEPTLPRKSKKAR